MTKLIVLDEMIGSMTEFKQIIPWNRLRKKRARPILWLWISAMSPACLLTRIGMAH